MVRTKRRIKALLDDRYRLVVVALIAIALAGVWLSYGAYAGAQTATEQRSGPTTAYTGSFDHEAVVVEPSPLYENGTILSNRTSYFSELTPVLSGIFRYGYSAATARNVTVDATVRLVVRSVDTDAEGGTAYWRDVRRLNRTSQSLEPDETVRLGFETNVTAMANESRRLDESVGGTPGAVRMTVVADVTTTGRIDGRQVNRHQTYELGLEPNGGIYRVADPGPITNTTAHTRTVTVERGAGSLRSVGGPVLVFVGLVGLVGLGFARYSGALTLTDRERSYLTYERHREEYDEWITSARLPPSVRDGKTVPVTSLEGLVDIAIDSDRRVLDDVASDHYVVVDDPVYVFDPPLNPDDSLWAGDDDDAASDAKPAGDAADLPSDGTD